MKSETGFWKFSFAFGVDWTLLAPALTLALIGMLTMSTFGQGASLAPRQMLWFTISVVCYFALSTFDMRFVRRTSVVMSLYLVSLALLHRNRVHYH